MATGILPSTVQPRQRGHDQVTFVVMLGCGKQQNKCVWLTILTVALSELAYRLIDKEVGTVVSHSVNYKLTKCLKNLSQNMSAGWGNVSWPTPVYADCTDELYINISKYAWRLNPRTAVDGGDIYVLL